MPITADMKRLAEDIEGSFDARVSDIAGLKENIHRMLPELERSRMEDFKSLQKEIAAGVKEMQSEVGSMIDSFHKWNVDTAKSLSNMLKEDRVAREKEVAGFLGEIGADLRDASDTWNRLTLDMSRKRSGKTAPAKQKTSK